MKKLLKLVFSRVVLIALMIAIQIAAVTLMLIKFQQYFFWFYAVSIVFSLIVVLVIINGRSNPSYKIAWIVPVLLFPLFGGLFYVIFGGNKLSMFTRKKMDAVDLHIKEYLPKHDDLILEIADISKSASLQVQYIQNRANCPSHKNTSVEYFPLGEAKFKRVLEELKKAEHYIFLEYFIIEEGEMWNSVLDILKEKAQAGVDVRVIYDDMGCIMTLPYHYNRKLEKMGIKCRVFNPFVPILSSKLNNRDHRKILVVDGHTGFTGGINLADEYINTFEKHGHWKDSAVMLKGDAVWNLTVMFLSMWDYICNIDEDFEQFKPHIHQQLPEPTDGYIQPYTDNPLDMEPVGETVYLNLINHAKKYIYITSPYLIIDNEMITALTIAAKSGLDVRIITPHVPDKRFVHAVTRAYYESLIESGVRIYEYTPGFIHAKNVVVDDDYATVGTINMDYRSLYLHFECGCFMYRCSAAKDVKKDFLDTVEKSEEITLKHCKSVSRPKRLLRAILRIFAPLM